MFRPCILLFFTIISHFVSPQEQPSISKCPNADTNGDWHYESFTDTCFFVSNNSSTWEDAEAACNTKQSHLASVIFDQQQFLTTVLSRYSPSGARFWIGLRLENPTTSQHMWVNGETARYRNWDVNEPSPHGLEACTTMNNGNGKWNDEYCQREYKYVCTLSKSAINASNEVPVQESWGCPDACQDCVVFRDHCYYFSPTDDKKTWQQAEEKCNSIYYQSGKGFRLISIHDSLEQDFVLAHMEKDRVARWTGLHEDPTKGDEFLYSDGTKVDYTYWNWGEPNFHRVPVCTVVLGGVVHAGRWNDQECTDTIAYICKMRRDSKFTRLPGLLGSICAPGFTAIGDACLKVIKSAAPGEYLDQAQIECSNQRAGSRVASILNVYENAMARVVLAATENFQQMADSDSRAWIALKLEGGKLSWQNSRCFPTFSNIPGFYDMPNLGGSVQCASMKQDGRWALESCQTARHMYTICEYRTKECDQIPIHFTGTCPENFPLECNDYCYRVEDSSTGNNPVAEKTTTFQSAKTACTELSGTLASIRDEEEQICLQNYVVHAKDPLWIGLNLHYDVTLKNYTWRWLDPDVEFGTYRNWAIGKPGTYSYQSCGSIDNQGLWSNSACDNRRGYVCEAKKFPNDTSTISSKCPAATASGDWHYESFTDICFFVSKLPATWESAESACNAQQSHLASVTFDQQQFLATVLKRYSPSYAGYWIGLRLEDPTTKQHMWVNGETARYRNWDVNEPSPHGLEACTTMNNGNGKWSDDYCQRKYKYVCTLSKSPINATSEPAVQETWGCPDSCPDCVIFRDHCYYFSPPDDKKTWQQAEEKCNSIHFQSGKGSRLVSIHDSWEQNFVLAQMEKDRIERWTGLHRDPARGNEFYYSDGTKVDYSYWNWGEPNLARVPVCTEILAGAGHAGRWNDHACTETNAYICKMRRDPKFTMIPGLMASKCSLGFTGVGDACFKVTKSASAGYNLDEAQAACSNQLAGSRVASIVNVYENAMARLVLATFENYQHVNDSRAWIALQVEGGKLSWQNSRCYPTFNNIPDFYNMPNQDGPRQCASMKLDGRWVLENCDIARQMYTICEYRTKECDQLPIHSNGICPGNFPLECSDYCYRIEQSSGALEGKTASFEGAETACEQQNGTLASIRNEEDQLCLQKYVDHARDPLWIGLYLHYEHFFLFFGEYSWRWLNPDVEFGTYSNWAIGKPSQDTDEACGTIDYQGLWSNSVSYDRRGYVCEAKKLPSDISTISYSSTVRAVPTTTPAVPTTTTAVRTTTTAVPTTTKAVPSTTTAVPTTITAEPTITTAARSTATAVPATSASPSPSSVDSVETSTIQTTDVAVESATDSVTPSMTATNPPSTFTSSTGNVDLAAVSSSVIMTTGRSNLTIEDPPGKQELVYFQNSISGGGLAGIAIAIIILVPALTYAAYFFLGRRSAAAVLRNQKITFRRTGRVDEDPVIDNEETYT